MPIFPIDNPAKPMEGTRWPDYLGNQSVKGTASFHGTYPLLDGGQDILELAITSCHGMGDAPKHRTVGSTSLGDPPYERRPRRYQLVVLRPLAYNSGDDQAIGGPTTNGS